MEREILLPLLFTPSQPVPFPLSLSFSAFLSPRTLNFLFVARRRKMLRLHRNLFCALGRTQFAPVRFFADKKADDEGLSHCSHSFMLVGKGRLTPNPFPSGIVSSATAAGAEVPVDRQKEIDRWAEAIMRPQPYVEKRTPAEIKAETEFVKRINRLMMEQVKKSRCGCALFILLKSLPFQFARSTSVFLRVLVTLAPVVCGFTVARWFFLCQFDSARILHLFHLLLRNE